MFYHPKDMRMLEHWENDFSKALQNIDKAEREKAGALLPVIPNREKWNQFLESVKTEWESWRRNLQKFPSSLIVLYDGVAFYEYYTREFWPQFAEAIGHDLPFSQRQIANEALVLAANQHDLKIRERQNGTDYVGSAVHHIGIPISLWDEFLEVCEWALSIGNWSEFSDEEWSEFATKRSLGRTRLKNFLVDNRDTASDFIKEMLDAREILIKDHSLTISDLKQASLLRPEYFEEVPETAEFLRPKDPESLIKDRARLVWYEDPACIRLHLPAVSSDKLPAQWKIVGVTQEAASTPDTLDLNSKAFDPSPVLRLKSGQQHETRWLQGISPWGLFDLERNRFVNLRLQQLPVNSYVIVSPEPLDEISCRGFDQEDWPTNDLYELEDGTECYVTYLYPATNRPRLSVNHAGKTWNIDFWTKSKIEARIFAGEESYAANFSSYEKYIKLERLPLLCTSIPLGFFENAEAALKQKFQVRVGGKLTEGTWEKRHEDGSREFYFWNWETELQPRKKVTVSVKSPGLGIEFDYPIEMLKIKDGTENCWQNLPGAFLPWVLLAQPHADGTKEGMKHNDLILAKNAITPDGQQGFSMSLLRKYAKLGLLKQSGQRWIIAESRAVFEPSVDGECDLRFCGNPALLWGLLRYMCDYEPNLPVVEVINKRGEPPYLLMKWKEKQKDKVKKYLEKHERVSFVFNLWDES